MREIKFRAWDKKDKRMIIHKQDFIPLMITSLGVFKLDPKIQENRWMLIDHTRFELMQYTGLKDSSGREIYEGDIFQWKGYEVRNGKQIRPIRVWVVEWEIGRLFQYKNICDTETHEVEIIGNIHENPELINA